MPKPREDYTVRLLADAPGKNGTTIAKGEEITGPQAFRLVQMGLAEPVCELAKARAELDATRRASAKLADERERKNARARAKATLDAKRAEERAAFERMLHGDQPAAEPPAKTLAKRKTETL